MDITARTVRILVAEDHALSRQIVANALRDCGVVDIEIVLDGTQACAAIDAARLAGKPFQIVFLDWEMPGMTGVDILRRYRARPDFDNVAFIMATAVSEQKHVIDAVRAGATAYIIKPTSQNAIARKFDEMLQWVRQKNKPAGAD
ncbi:MAG: response regulator [Alphaproteobacteria bacterium]|nr:response regulator [Alphaproteobacteria bacterium]